MVKRVPRSRWYLVAGVVLVVGVIAPTVAGSDRSHRASADPATIPCESVQRCHQQVQAIDHNADVLLPDLADLVFTDGFVANPHVERGGFLGELDFRDTSDSQTVSYVASKSPQWYGNPGFRAGCESLVGTVSDTPKGRLVCINEPRLGVERITIVDTYYEQDGVFYWVHMDDHRPPTASIWDGDRVWALATVDSLH
jgi:hypothetical protein